VVRGAWRERPFVRDLRAPIVGKGGTNFVKVAEEETSRKGPRREGDPRTNQKESKT